MGKKSRAKQNGKSVGAVSRAKKELLKLATELFKLGVNSPSRQNEWDYYLKLHNAVEEFTRRQNSSNKPAIPVVDRQAASKNFETWLKDNSVSWDKVKLNYFGGDHGFGLVATEDVDMKSLLMSIPRKMMITYEDAANSYLDEVIAGNEVLSVMPNVCLALFLHCERHIPDSKFKPYIDVMPSEFNTILYFTPEEMKHLKGSTALSSAISQYKSIVRQFALLYQVFNSDHQKSDIEKVPLVAKDTFTFDAYRWCVSAVTTRQNKIPSTCLSEHGDALNDDLSSMIALIPLWDMFNHSTGPLSTTFNVTAQSIDCFAMRDFKAEEEVTICYGGRPNCDLLIHNGFIVAENPFDKVKIHLGVSPKDPLFHKRAKLLSKLNLDVSGQFQVCAMDSNLPTSPGLIAFLRVFHMDRDELDEWLKKEIKELTALREVYITGPLVFKADPQMWLYLENRVSLLLMGIERTFENNLDAMLDDKSLTVRAKLALQLRNEERRVLAACMKFCQQYRASLTAQKSLSEETTSGDSNGFATRNAVLDNLVKRSAVTETPSENNSVTNDSGDLKDEQLSKITLIEEATEKNDTIENEPIK